MIDEILQFHDKGDDILEELCELLGVDALIIDFEHYDNTSIEINHDSPQEIFDFLTNQIRQETDVIRKKCLAFILAKIIEKTHLIPSITIDFLEDDSESPYVLFRLANIFYQVSDFQPRCIEIFRQIIINKENHMDMRFEATENLNHLARIGDCPTLIPILLEILALDEYHFEDSYFAGHDFGATIFPDDDCGFDPNYSEYWIIDISR